MCLQLYDGNVEVWTREVTPVGSLALAVVNKYHSAYPVIVKLTLKDVGFTNPGGYNLTELFDGRAMGVYKPNNILESRINPSGIQLYKATALTALKFDPSVFEFYWKYSWSLLSGISIDPQNTRVCVYYIYSEEINGFSINLYWKPKVERLKSSPSRSSLAQVWSLKHPNI